MEHMELYLIQGLDSLLFFLPVLPLLETFELALQLLLDSFVGDLMSLTMAMLFLAHIQPFHLLSQTVVLLAVTLVILK